MADEDKTKSEDDYDSSNEYDYLELPSGKVGAITRKQNSVTKYFEKGKIEADKLKEFHASLTLKIKAFEEACLKQKEKNLCKDDTETVEKYMRKNRKKYLTYMNKLEKQILEAENDSEKESSESEDEEEDGYQSDSENNNTAKLLSAILKNQNVSKLPSNEPSIFNGENITEYNTFMLSFERLIEEHCLSDKDKYYYLLRYTAGDANQLVSSCHNVDASKAFDDAKNLLKDRFGNEYVIAQKYLDRLYNWPVIKSEDSVGLNKFASYITTCCNMMKNMSALNQLNSLRDIKEIMMKLPYDMRKSFRSIVDRNVCQNKVIDFKLFVDFVNTQSRMQNLPMIGQISDRQHKTERHVSTSKHATFFTKKENNDLYCHCCKKNNHCLNDCIFFLKKTVAERENFIKTKGLCFGCLNTGHRYKDCETKMKCTKCDRMHPSCLHRMKSTSDDVRRSTNNDASNKEINMKTRDNERIVCPAVAVVIRNKLNGKKIEAFAALDNYSTSSYMNAELIEKLDLLSEEKSLNVQTIEGDAQCINVSVVKNLEITNLAGNSKTKLAKVYAKNKWPFTEKDSPSVRDIENITLDKNIPFNFISGKIEILIGMDNPDILQPRETVKGKKNGPYATRHILGWALNGPVKGSKSNLHCFRTVVRENDDDLHNKIEEVFNKDFISTGELSNKYSIEDKKWLDFVESHTNLVNGSFEVSLPFKNNSILNENNYFQVKARFGNLAKKLRTNNDLCNEYCDFMKMMLDNNFMEVVPDCDTQSKSEQQWFVAHHPVWHKQKKKIRVVFDCSLKYKGISINDALWKGPDLTNTLTGVLLRFRSENIAVNADISKMFYRVKLPIEDRNFFKFLWFPNHNIYENPVEYRMTAHIFGATSSPAVANFALGKTVEAEKSPEVRDIVTKSFYVDDMIHSFETIEGAIRNLPRIEEVLDNHGFELTSYSSNSREVLKTIDPGKLSKNITDIDITEELPQERALGIKWKPSLDTIGYNLNIVERSITKRGILSSIHAIYDPLFIVSPVIIPAKRLFQNCCQLKLDWDDLLPSEYQERWKRWQAEITKLKDFEIPRCYKGTERVKSSQLHIFCDGSDVAYGAVAYLRQVDYNNSVFSSIVMAKARLTPISRSALKTIPRIELNAAKLGVLLFEQISEELTNIVLEEEAVFWTDSEAVLRYLKSETGRFHIFVANRVAFIRSSSRVEQWRKVPGKINPADMLSRGVSDVSSFNTNVLWKEGPSFLRKPEVFWPVQHYEGILKPDDPEFKKNKTCFMTKTDEVSMNSINKLMNSCSNMFKLKCRVATFLRLKNILRKQEYSRGKINCDEIARAEIEIYKYVQCTQFPSAIAAINSGKLPLESYLKKLNLFIDEYGLLRIGGRLKNASINYDTKYPILLHAVSHPVKILIRETHNKLGHLGRGAIATHLKQRFHIVSGGPVIRKIIKNCIICKKVQGTVCTQIMCDLPSDRLEINCAPFSNTGTDLFGPFYVTKGRGKQQEKRYGVVFTCLSSRAIHLEIVSTLEADAYLNAFRRFVCRRGTPKIMRSDNGTNLRATDKELKIAFNELNLNSVSNYCIEKHIDWKFQPPNASHFGGVFEREIRTIRKVLSSIFNEYHNKIKLTDEILSTWFCEVENILNCRPLTAVTTDDNDCKPLTANDLLRLNSADVYPFVPFNVSDTCMKRRWRQAQHLADIFWYRFRREYLQLLQSRNKWQKCERSLQVNDIVLVVDKSLPRNNWCVGKIINVKLSSDNKVRCCDVSILSNKFSKDSWKKDLITRPITKLILLCTNDAMSV